MDNKNKKTVIEQKIASPKLFLFISILLLFASGIAVIVSLIVGGYDFIYYIFPVSMVLCDLVFGLVTIFSNYRFRYSIPYPIIYLIATMALTVAAVVTNGGSSESLFTYLFAGAFLILHLIVGTVSVILCYGYASYGKGSFARKLASFLSVAVLCASVAAYSSMVINDGWFGQGAVGVERPVEFHYNSLTDSYTVVGVLNGKGDTVVIPSEFNGKKISLVDCKIFGDESIKSIYLEEGILYDNLQNPKYLYSTGDRVIYAESCDDIRNGLFLDAYETYSDTLLNVANSVVPALEEGKVFVTFTYGMEDLRAVKGIAVPVWVGNDGDTLTDDTLKSVDYIAHKYDKANKDNNHWAYENIGKRIYDKALFEEGYGFGHVVDKNLQNVRLHFEPLLQIKVSNDNDTVHPEPDSFKYYTYSGVKVDNIFVASELDEWFAKYESRDGFELSWEYSEGSVWTAFSKLSDVAKDGMSILPTWEMKAPVINSVSSSGTIVYGQTAKLSSSCASPSDTLELYYDWSFNGETVSEEGEFNITNALPSSTGTYKLTLTAKNESISSLEAKVSKTVDLTVNKRPLTVIWTLPPDSVYSANEKTVYMDLDFSSGEDYGIINGDAVALTKTEEAITNVKYDSTGVVPHKFNAALALYNDLYEITAETRTNEFKIYPAPLKVTWSNTSLVYNSYEQAPTAEATGLGMDGVIPLDVFGFEKNAGNNYTATAVSRNTNYAVTDATKDQLFTIAPAQTNVTWGNTVFTYNAKEQVPTPYAPGVGGDLEVELTVKGMQKNAGENYTATIDYVDPNYTVVSGNSVEFKIEPLVVDIQWNNQSLVYNAAAQQPIAVTNGAVGSDNVVFSVTGQGTAVGDSYPASVDKDTTGNYLASSETNSTVFQITQAPLKLTWNLEEIITYNGQNRNYEVTPSGVQGNDTVTFVYSYAGTSGSTVSPVNKGDYSVTATLDALNSVNSNYYISEGSLRNITVKPLGVIPVWSSGDFTYDGTLHSVSVESFAGLTDTSLVDEVTLDLIYTNEENTNAGHYTASVALQENSNFSISQSASYNYDVARRELSVSWSEASFTFDGTQKTVNATVTGMIPAHSQEDVVSVVNNAYTDAGQYTAKAELIDENYIINANSEKTLIIDKKTVDAIWENTEVTFDGSAHSPHIYYMDVESQKVVIDTSNATVTNYSNTNAKEYTVSVTYTNKNYRLNTATTSHSFKIDPMEITVEWDTDSFIYNGSAQIPVPTAKNEGYEVTINGLRGSVLEGKNGINVGSYKARAVLGDIPSNYKVLSGAEQSYLINALEVKLVWTNTSVIFNNETRKPTASVTDSYGAALPTAVKVSVNISMDRTCKNAGDYTATGTLTNTNLTIVGGTETSSFEISPLEVEFRLSGTSSFEYNGKEQKPLVKAYAVSGGSLVSYANPTVSVSSGDGINFGSHQVRAALDSNYTVVGDATFSYNITAKRVTLSWSPSVFTYNGFVQTPTASVISQSDSSVDRSVSVDVILGTGDHMSAGKHTVSGEINSSNYTVVGGGSFEYTINKKSVTLTYGTTSFIYDGASHKPTVIAKDSSGKDCTSDAIVSVDLTGTYDGILAGTHQIKVTLSDNYSTSSSLTKSYQIAKCDITVTWTQYGGDRFYTPIIKEGNYSWNLDASLYEVKYYIKNGSSWTLVDKSEIASRPGSYKAEIVLKTDNYKFKDASTKTYEFNVLAAN